MRLEEICQRLEALLAAKREGGEKLEASVDAVSRIFGVKPTEVAVFSFDREQDCFNFIWPVELRKSGSIPSSADRSLLALTAKGRQGRMNNNFASTPHLFVFESFGTDKAPIQRIMSAPLVRDDAVIGVLQVCRKGTGAGDDLRKFTEQELKALCSIAGVVARHL